LAARRKPGARVFYCHDPEFRAGVPSSEALNMKDVAA
jgi:hypothetical protein